MGPSDAVNILIIIILLILSAYFSSAETALTTVNKIRMRSLAEENNKAAKRVLKLIEEPSKMLSAVLICNNIVNLSASSISTSYAFSICKRIGMENSTSLFCRYCNRYSDCIDFDFWRNHAKKILRPKMQKN
ncbi:MAG: CNNM domain-containing protein [Clostridium sp.]